MSIKNELASLPQKDDTNFFIRVLKYFVPWVGDTISDLFRKFIFVASLVVFSICVLQLVDFYYGTEESRQANVALQELSPKLDNEPVTLPPDAEPPDNMLPQWYELYSLNKDVIGWIDIPTFRADPDDEKTMFINYPVMQSKDNDYYLYKNIYKEYCEWGSLFADYYYPVTGYERADNMVIYGHNMRSLGNMFTHLLEYKRGVDFLKKNPLIDFNTIYTKDDRYIIVAAFIGTSEENQDTDPMFDYWRFGNFEKYDKKKDKKEPHYSFNNFYKGITSRSWYSSDIDCTEDDEYITLSTCSNEVKGLRWVITARKIRDDETEDDIKKMIKSYKKKDDKDIKLPSSWVNVWGQVTMYKGWDY